MMVQTNGNMLKERHQGRGIGTVVSALWAANWRPRFHTNRKGANVATYTKARLQLK